jgi:signal transduction histidine kinase
MPLHGLEPRTARRRTIRGRLGRIMALPLLTVAVLFIIVVAQESSTYNAATATNGAANLLVKVNTLVNDLQDERAWSVQALSGNRSAGTDLAGARAKADSAAKAISGTTVAGLHTALTAVTNLGAVRTKVDGNRITRDAAFDAYSSAIGGLLGVDVGADDSTDAALRSAVATDQALREIQEAVAQERAFLFGVFTAGGFGPGEYREYVAMHAALATAHGHLTQSATPQQTDMLVSTMDTPAAQSMASLENRALDAIDAPLNVNPQTWWNAATSVAASLSTDEARLATDISNRSGQLARTAGTALVALIAFAVVSALGAAILIFSAARSITRPLAALAAEALTMATIRLPEAVERLHGPDSGHEPEPPPRVTVPARSSAEISAVAEALDSAQSTAYELATEQARLRRSTSESLANLGRRNQNLLRRQLGFITQLEREETDPSGLANLFELDHLATRMRRNAESLLVLVGESSPRTWSEALPVADVLRAAISEVEDYRRVTLKRVDDAYVGGAFVAGIAHMIAELVENGLAFSPPDVDVEIQGRLLPGRYLIGITDQGLGMDPEDMARANARLRGEESFLSAPTRYLGHYVVGHLARQMGIDVELTASPVTGVAARVLLPASVLAARPAAGLYDGRPDGARVSPTGDLRGGAALVHNGQTLAIDAVAVEEVEFATAAGATQRPDAPNWATVTTGPLPIQEPAQPFDMAQPDGTAQASGNGAGGLNGGPTNGHAHANGWAVTGPSGPGWAAAGPSGPGWASSGSGDSGWASSGSGGSGVAGSGPIGQVGPGLGALGGPGARDVAAALAHGQGERTRNGLVKRIPRPRRGGPGEEAAAPEPVPNATPDESAAKVRSQLTSLRAGVARGEHDHSAGGRPAESPGATSESGPESERSPHAG